MAGDTKSTGSPATDEAASSDDDSLLRAVAHVSEIARRAPAADEPDPERIGHFRIAARLGRGGMGIVYRAEDEKLRRTVALKVLPTAFAADEERRRRFLREARAAAAISHPNVATIFDVGEADGRIFIAMELVEGRTLRAQLAKGAAPVAEALRIVRAIAQGLARAHARGIVHRDLKPDNVMIDERGEVKILDFGLAKAREQVVSESALEQAVTETQTQEGRILGTPGYMSPEQARGTSVDARSDLFSLGVVLYELLTGVPPFRGSTPFDVLVAVSRDQPEPVRRHNPDASAAIEQLLARLLAKDPESRYPDVDALLAAIDAQPSSVSTRLPRAALVLTACVLTVAVAAVLAAKLRPASQNAVAASASTPAASVPSAAPTVVTGLPPPRTTNAEAAAAYVRGLQALRDAAIVTASNDFARAAQLDPALAAAHVQLLLVSEATPISIELSPGASLDRLRQHASQASQLRASLGERDGAILEAAKADVATDTPDLDAKWRRWQALAARFSGDAEIVFAAALRARSAGHDDDARALSRRALDLDPGFAWPHQLLADMALDAGDLDGALGGASECLRVSPSASACLVTRAEIESRRGDCERVEEDARRMIAADPNDVQAYNWLEIALTSRNAPHESILQARRRGTDLMPPGEAKAFRQLVDPTLGPWLDGDFEGEARFFAEWDEELRTATASESWARRMTFGELYTFEESGQTARAVAVADDYLKRVSAFTRDEAGFARAFALEILHRAGRIPDGDARAMRDGWIRDARVRLPPQSANRLWFDFYAGVARTPADAREALESLRSFSPLPRYDNDPYLQREMGVVLWLAGRVDDSIPYLRRSPSCFTLFGMVEHVRAHEYLGEALESKGDKEGACAEYGKVLARWGHARPRSITADAARTRARKLGCAQTR